MLLGWLVGAVITIIPLWMILPRAGIPAPWALAAAVPLGAVVILWVLALRRWPDDNLPGRF